MNQQQKIDGATYAHPTPFQVTPDPERIIIERSDKIIIVVKKEAWPQFFPKLGFIKINPAS